MYSRSTIIKERKRPSENKGNDENSIQKLEEENFLIQDTKVTEIDQVIYNLESSFHESVGQEIDTEWSQPKEQTMESIFVLQEASTPEGACLEHLDIHHKISPESNTMTSQPKQLVPTNLLIQPQCNKPTKTVTTHVKKKVEEIIQRDTKYSNIRRSYSFKTTIIMFQLFLAVILILAVSHQCDASMATIALLPLIKGATSHSSTWLQVKNIVPKQKHWVEKLRHPNVNWESSHWVNLFSLELQPENFTKKIGTALGNKSKQHQYIDLSSRKNNSDKDPLPTSIKFWHYNDVYCCPDIFIGYHPEVALHRSEGKKIIGNGDRFNLNI